MTESAHKQVFSPLWQVHAYLHYECEGKSNSEELLCLIAQKQETVALSLKLHTSVYNSLQQSPEAIFAKPIEAVFVAGVVDVCLIPEVKFELDVLTEYVKEVMRRKGHCVVCIAEGAGQDIVQHGHTGTDKSGNPILKDIGTHVRDIFKECIEVSAGSVAFSCLATCVSNFVQCSLH